MERDLTIILVAYNSAKTLRRSLQSLRDYAPELRHEIVVVDNASPDESAEIAAEFAGVHVLRIGENRGFGAGNNAGAKAFPARYYYLHNTDAYLRAPVLDRAVKSLQENDKIGIAGLPLVYPDGSPQTGAYAFTTPLKWALQGLGIGGALRWMLRTKTGRVLLKPLAATRMGRSFYATESGAAQTDGSVSRVDWVTGAAMLIRHEAWADMGGFDEDIFLYGEDEDLCRVARQHGWEVAQIAVAPVEHDFGWGSSGRASKTVARLKADSLAVFIDKHFRGGRRAAMRTLLWLKRKAWGV